MTRKPRKRRAVPVKVTRDEVAAAIGQELHKRFARMSAEQLGHLFLFLSTGRAK